MLLTEVLAVAFASLKANTMRSLLTMLGIIIGVASVIAMIALGTGAENAIKDRLAKLGTTGPQINTHRGHPSAAATSPVAKLTLKDVRMIEEMSPHVIGVNPQQDRDLAVVWGSHNTNVQVTGTAANFLEVR